MDNETSKDKKSEFIGIRISPWMKELLSDEAKQRGLTLSVLCLDLIVNSYLELYGEEQ